VEFKPIAQITTPYKTKFAIPRQPGLVPAATGEIWFHAEYNTPEIVRGLEQFSHIWLVFCFHHTAEQGWKSLVRPPRLGGNKQIGVLASRSTFRPNPIGLSLVKLDSVQLIDNQPRLQVSGIDLVDNTPILDIKPYLPYADINTEAKAGYAASQPQPISVTIPDAVQQDIQQIEQQYTAFGALLEQVLSQDPRPAYRSGKPDHKTYGVTLYDYDIRFHYPALDRLELVSITPVAR